MSDEEKIKELSRENVGLININENDELQISKIAELADNYDPALNYLDPANVTTLRYDDLYYISIKDEGAFLQIEIQKQKLVKDVEVFKIKTKNVAQSALGYAIIQILNKIQEMKDKINTNIAEMNNLQNP